MNYNNKMQRSQMVLRFKAFSFVKIQGVLLRRAVFICLKKPLRLKLQQVDKLQCYINVCLKCNVRMKDPENQQNENSHKWAADLIPWARVTVVSTTTRVLGAETKYWNRWTNTGRGTIFRLAVLSLGTTSLVKDLFLDSTGRSACL